MDIWLIGIQVLGNSEIRLIGDERLRGERVTRDDTLMKDERLIRDEIEER